MNPAIERESLHHGGEPEVSSTGQDGVVLGRRRIYILPTAQGVAFGGALMVMLLGSVNYNNGLGYVLTFLLASLAMVSILHTYRNLAGLRLRAGLAPPVHAGGTAQLRLHLDNRAGCARAAVLLRYAVPAGEGKSDDACVRLSLAREELRRVALPVPAARRGRLRIESVTVATRFPFGLFRAWSRAALALECIVYPSANGTRSLPPSASNSARESGAHGVGQEDFSGFRDYVPGDSPRQIHWKAVAREQGIPVKLFSGASAAELELRWEDTPGGDAEARLSQLCRWVLEAQARGLRYGVSLPGEYVAPGGGDAHLHSCLRALALFGQD